MSATQEFPPIEDATAARLLRRLQESGQPFADTLMNQAATPDEYEDAKVNLCAVVLGVFQAIEGMSGT